jgi:AcrR family transcriptional regulator
MVRTVKEREHAAKRDEIVIATQRLVETKGYERLTIQDILDDLRISKGALYHYFDSKAALLEALVQRMLDEALRLLLPIAQDPHLTALEKLQHYFAAFFRWRTDRREVLLALLRVWYTDDNTLVREKVRRAMIEHFTPLLAGIIRQGIQEGILTTPYPEQVASVVVILRMGLSEALAELLVTFDPEHDTLSRIESTIAVYTDAIERVLGLPRACLMIADAETLRSWFA